MFIKFKPYKLKIRGTMTDFK